MTNVELSIAGRSYSVACAKGEEARITALGRMIDAKLAGNAGLRGQSEARSLLFAALLLADELHDLKASAAAPEPAVAPVASPSADPQTAEKLEALADRLESLASQLEVAG